MKWNAVPTLFDIPNPPKSLTLKRPLNQLTIKKSKLNSSQSATNFHNYSASKRPRLADVENILPITPTMCDHVYSQSSRRSLKFPDNVFTPELASNPGSLNSEPEVVESDAIKNLKLKVRTLKRQLITERQRSATFKRHLERFLNADQLACLNSKTQRAAKWSNKTIKESLQIRCAAGSQGYTYLRKKGYPLPSYRTLCQRVEKAQFRPGLQLDVLEWLRVKLQSLPSAMNKDCVLAIDEMQLRPTIEYDKGSQLCNLCYYLNLVNLSTESLKQKHGVCYSMQVLGMDVSPI